MFILSPIAWRARSISGTVTALTIFSLLAALSGCRIPTLRCPQPGPMIPQAYQFPVHVDATAGNSGPTGMRQNGGAADSTGKTPATGTGQDGDASDSGDDNDKADDSGTDEQKSPSDESASDTHGRSSVFKLINFVRPAHSLELKPVDEPEGSASDPNAGVQNTAQAEATTEKADSKSVKDGSSAASQPPKIPADNIPTVPSDMNFGNSSLDNSAQVAMSAFFNDPFLVGLINEALVGNQELKILSENIQIASNEVLARSGEYRPFVTLGAGAGLEKSSRFSRNGAVEDQLDGAPGKAFPDPLPDFLVGTNVSWELDIWKKLRNAQNAAAMRYLGTRDGRNYIVTRMVAEVAENYYKLLALDNRMTTLDKTIHLQQQSLQISQAMMEAARGTQLAVQRFQAEVRKNESERMIIQQEITQVENRINFLLGRYPQPIGRPPVEYVDLNLNALSAGVPAQLLQNRSDIRQAERELTAAGLDIQVARARFYPSLGLRAGVGLNAFNTKYLLSTPESLVYNAAMDLVGPLINRRAIKADYFTANARQLQALYEYQRTILNAHLEVVNHMTKVENYRQSIEVKKQQLAALEASIDSATKLFQSAHGEYLDVLLVQREFMEAKMLTIETKQEQLGAIVNAYQALGGGGF